MDRAGRIVVPRGIRERLRIQGGAEVDIAERDGVIEITVAAASVSIAETVAGPVAVAPPGTPALTDAVVSDTLDQIRR